ncbi:MAG: response regulator [Pyrinomonadaceae bacterium]
MHIFYIEDNKLVVNAVKETLELEGWSGDEYSDSLAALEKLKPDAPYDFIITDYDPPGIDGRN